MTLNFTNNGIRYSLVTISPGLIRGEVEIRPDPTLWASDAQKHMHMHQQVDMMDSREYANAQRIKRQKAWKRHYNLTARGG